MNVSSLLDRAAYTVATAMGQTAMANLPPARGYALFPATVLAISRPSRAVRRITLSAPQFADLDRAGADEYFGLLIPGLSGRLVLPGDDCINIRAALATISPQDRPVLRWYTIRNHDRVAATIDIDIVTHGQNGPGSAWALNAAPGNKVGFRQCGALFLPPATEHICFVADETSAPGVAAIVESYGLPESHIIVETIDADHLTPLPQHLRLDVLERGRVPGERALAALTEVDTSKYDFFYLCGESRLAASCRRYLIRECGVDKHRIIFSGFWKLGQART